MLIIYQKLLEIVGEEVSLEDFAQIAREIYKRERRFSYKDFHKSSAFCASQLKKYGASQLQVISLPSDGKTTYIDEIMPQSWDITDASLEIVSSPDLPFKILASHKEEPHCIANRSAPTPKDGVEAYVVLEEDMRKGEGIKGKIVFTTYAPPKKIKGKVVREGGSGIISDYSPDRLEMPDSTFWINGWSEGPGWYHTKEEKSLFCFSITPRKGELLRNLIRERGGVKVKALVKSRLYDGTIDTVTGIIQGEKKEEILLLAHLYEPQASDDATGGAALIEICRTLNALINGGKLRPPKLTIRFLLSQELYGFSAFLQDKEIRKKILATINLDSFSFNHKESGIPLNLRMNSPSQPFFGDILLKSMSEYYFKKEDPSYPWEVVRGTFSDDTFMADTSLNIPTNWFFQIEGRYWHSSLNTFDKVDWLSSVRIMTLIAAYTYFLASMGKEDIYWLMEEVSREGKKIIFRESQKLIGQFLQRKDLNYYLIEKEVKERLEFVSSWQKGRLFSLLRFSKERSEIKEMLGTIGEEIENISREEGDKVLVFLSKALPLFTKKKVFPSLTRKEKIAQNMILERKTIGFPHCLARVPFPERVERPFGVLETLSWVDGRKDFLEIINLVGQEIERKPTQEETTNLIHYLHLLDKYGYLRIRYKVELDKEDIKKALTKIGLKKGDVVFVHSSLSALGHIKGDADTVIGAFLETLGSHGTLLMTTHCANFTTVHDGLERREGEKQAYNPKLTPSRVGKISDTFWRRKGVLRSAHPTHSVAARGPLAEEMLGGHTVKSNPCGKESPFRKMVEYNGYFLFFGAEMTTTTFFHAIEDWQDLPYLQKSKVLIDNKGKEEMVIIKGSPSGHRDFYALPNKIMTKLRQAKLDLKVLKVGMGEIKMVNAQELYRKTTAIVEKEPDIFLCDDPKCEFCSKWKKELQYKNNKRF